MKRIAFLAALGVLAAVPAWAQGQGKQYFTYPTAGALTGAEIIGPVRQNNADRNLTSSALLGTVPVATNTVLKAVPAGAFATAYRSGFAVAGDGGAATYTWSGTACPLNAGAGDNGSQVAPAVGTGCWLLQPANPTDIRVWGAKADNATDVGPFMQAAYTANVGCISIPAGIFAWSTAVTMTAQVPCFRGSGWNEATQIGALSTSNMTGTWLHFSSAGFSPVTISAITGQGGIGGFSGIAFYQDQPAPGGGWAPTAYPYIFTLSNNLGRVDFDNLMFYNTTHCISISASSRNRITNIAGQPLGTCLAMDNQTDTSFYQNIDFWPFWSQNTNVVSYTQLNADAILFQRSDTPFISRVFSLGYHSTIAFSQSANGVTTGAQLSDISGDAGMYGLWIKPGTTGVQLQIGSLRTAGQGFPAGTLAGSEGYRDEGTGTTVDIGNFDCFYAGSNCIDIKGTGRVSIGNTTVWNFNYDNNSSVGIQAGASGWVSLANPPVVTGAQFGAPVIPATSLGGIYAIRGVRQKWTPTITSSGTIGTVAYATQLGTFWYDGSLSILSFNLSISSFTGFTGNISIAGFPIVGNAATGQNLPCTIQSQSGITLGAGYTVLTGVLAGGGATQFQITESGTGVSTIQAPASIFGSSFTITGSCMLAGAQ